MIHVNPTFQYIEDSIFKHCINFLNIFHLLKMSTMLHKLGEQWFHNEIIIIFE
jgi:hypothetical protein